MPARIYVLWLLLCGLSCLRAIAQPTQHRLTDTLYLRQANSNHLSETYRYCTEPFGAPVTPEHADSLWHNGQFRAGPWHRTLNLGFTHRRVWMRLNVANTLSHQARFLWSLYNYTDSATLYWRPAGESRFVRVISASSQQPTTQRAFPARALCLPFMLAAHERGVLYLRIDHHAGALYLPTDVTTTEDFLAWEVNYPFDQHWIWLIGFYLSSALFNLMLFAFLRDRIHVWYVLYVVCTTIFLLMEDGLDSLLLPNWLYRVLWHIGQFNFMLLASACGMHIMQLFLRLRKDWPRLHRGGTWLALLVAVFVGLYTLLYPLAMRVGGAGLFALNAGREVLLLATFVYGWVALLAVARTSRRRLAAYFGLTYFFFFTGFSLFWLNHLGITNLHLLQPNALAWGLFFELLMLSVLLMGRFRHALRQNARLRIRQLRQRNALSSKLIAAQEVEREQLARELHDALGPNLAALHLAYQGPAMREAFASSPAAAAAGHHTELLLRHLRDEVRTFSHSLIPTEPGQGTLTESIATLRDLFNLYGNPTIRTYCDEGLEQLPPRVQQAAYRITAELLNNALRHARASEVLVQLLRHADVLEILVEDNGRGMPATPSGRGIGLRGVQARTDYLQGSLHIDSSEHGTSVFVRLPYKS
ncbi:7TM diverse intracellular signaling domain-containing protein [Hymenobacter sp. GOD-10R]|uniref:sensor histidine kinase n=1 Tax=Hymenobacter sp. GOD-10R TaxID=3093922 RepID=UPI002D78A019|nr:7TM diverse intracellular signaling domain-containing protein [Hymenobacter sp. GOD-10R]WRQ29484.1 7TM diverse intracellular signaling domain-containing protein [Hymenobacter sp. GOD-10R]